MTVGKEKIEILHQEIQRKEHQACLTCRGMRKHTNENISPAFPAMLAAGGNPLSPSCSYKPPPTSPRIVQLYRFAVLVPRRWLPASMVKPGGPPFRGLKGACLLCLSGSWTHIPHTARLQVKPPSLAQVAQHLHGSPGLLSPNLLPSSQGTKGRHIWIVRSDQDTQDPS